MHQSDVAYAPTPDTEYEALSPEYYYSPAPAPAPESEYEEILSPAPAPEPAEDDLAPLEAPVPAPITMPEIQSSDGTESSGQQAAPEDPDAVDFWAPPPPAYDAVPSTSVLSSNYSAEDEDNELVQEQDASRANEKTAGVVLFGVVAGFCVVGFGGLVYKKRKDGKRTQYYEALAKKEGI